MELKVTIKNVFGQDLVYPACDTSQVITRIAGRKTLSKWDINQLKSVGFTFTVLTPEL